MNGTVTATINVFYLDGRLAWQARNGDRVNIVNGKLTQLSRNGQIKITGVYNINLDYVNMDNVEVPPPDDDPPPPDPTPLTDYWIHYDGNGVEIERFYRANPK